MRLAAPLLALLNYYIPFPGAQDRAAQGTHRWDDSSATMAKRISANELKEWITQSPSKVLIIDVRQDDVYGGHIVGSKNVPFHKVSNELPRILEEAKGKQRVVFHCSLSQQRGPEASRLFSQALAKTSSPKPTVYILDGGKY